MSCDLIKILIAVIGDPLYCGWTPVLLSRQMGSRDPERESVQGLDSGCCLSFYGPSLEQTHLDQIIGKTQL